MTDLPLAGTRVLDVSTVLAAPVTATFLGDFGAEVVKVEEPTTGDFTRGGAGGQSLGWLQEGRNKQSVTLDLRTPAGQDLLHGLVPHFDVIVTNFRPPTLAKWRMTPDELQALHPAGIFVYLTGYGLTGPYRDRGAFDRTASAFAGLTYTTGEPGRPPTRSGYSTVDYMSAYLAAFAVVTALYHRDLHGGPGQVIDLALYEAGFRAAEDSLVDHAVHGRVRERLGNRNPRIVPASDFATADGRRVTIHAGTNPLFRRLATAMGRPELASDEHFATAPARIAHQDELYAIIGDWVAARDADDVAASLNAADVPTAPIMSIADIATDPHYRERGTITTVDHADHGPLPMVAPLPHLSATPGSIRTLGPPLGAHTDDVYARLLGLSPADLADLRAAGVI